MLLKKRLLINTILFLFTLFGFSQNEIDSVQKKSYQELFTLIKESKDQKKRFLYANIYVAKAKEEKNVSFLIRGYHIQCSLHKDEKQLQYADSLINITAVNSSETYPAIAYQIKGDFYYNKNMYEKAFENYLSVDKYAKKHNSKRFFFRSNLNIGNLKRQLKEFDEALELYRENFEYTEKKKDSVSVWDRYTSRNHLASIASMANIFNDMQEVDSAAFYNKYGIKEALRLKEKFYYGHFALNQGVTSYYDKKYQIAIDSIEKHIPYFEERIDSGAVHLEELSIVYYYCGESYFKLKKPQKAIEYFKKVDAIFDENQSLFPNVVESYTRLIDYYKDQEDVKNLMFYVGQLRKLEKILHSDEVYLKGGILKEYDIPKLEKEIEGILQEQKEKEIIYRIVKFSLLAFILLLTLGFVFQYRKKKLYKERFNAIIDTEAAEKLPAKKEKKTSPKELNIPQDIVDGVLKGLGVFEKEERFTSNKITLNYLAKKLHTNPNYLSKIINHYKETTFSTYLSNLRVEYAVQQLKENSEYRKYTIKAIAFEVGFNNVQSFTKAFNNKKGINPSYFIKELKKIEKEL